jgi:hypothetical protein
LIRIKNLIGLNQPLGDEEECDNNCCLLGSQEMNLVLSYPDIKMYLDINNLYSLIECNYDSFKECVNPDDIIKHKF